VCVCAFVCVCVCMCVCTCVMSVRVHACVYDVWGRSGVQLCVRACACYIIIHSMCTLSEVCTCGGEEET